MVDILANGDWGRDDGIVCNLEVNGKECGGKTYLTYDQGGGLKSYDCEKCGGTFQVQYEREEPDSYEEDYYPDYEEIYGGEG